MDEDHALQVIPFEHGPSALRQVGAVHAVASVPRPFHGRFISPLGQAIVHLRLDVAELELAHLLVFELDERLHFFVEVVLIRGGHRDDVPSPQERLTTFPLRPCHRVILLQARISSVSAHDESDHDSSP